MISGKQDSTVFKPNNAQIKYAHEAAVYLQDDWEINEKIKIHAGLRGKSVKNYGGLEPRFTIRYALNDETSVKGSVTRNLQYIHMVSMQELLCQPISGYPVPIK